MVPIGLSALALAVSLVTSWRTHFTRFNLIAASGPMTMRIHRFKSEGESWLLPHLVVSLSVTNSGAQIGRVLDSRLTVRYPNLPVADAYETFELHGEYDRKAYEENAAARLRMITEARLDDGVPFVVLPKSTVTKFLLFSTRWDQSVRQSNFEVALEVLTDKRRKWITIEKWNFHVNGTLWRGLEELDTSLAAFPTRYFEMADRPSTNPADLHEYTRDPDVERDSAEFPAPSHEVLPPGSSSGKRRKGATS